MESATMARKSFARKSPAPPAGAGAAHPAEVAGAPPFPQILSDNVSVETPDGAVDAYFVRPDTGAHPGILMWPDALSIRPAFQGMAERLARSGYSVLLVNPFYRTQATPIPITADRFYDDPVARSTVLQLARSVTHEMTVSDAGMLVAYLERQSSVDSSRKLGTMGYCVGGGMAIATAAVAPDTVNAVASFHGGNLVTADPNSPHRQIARTRAGALIAIAEDDDEKDPEAKAALARAFDSAGLTAEIEVYRGAMHGWCVPDTRSYNEAQAERAWSRMLALLGSQLS
jgi:carboxymethylenebutenolidase